MTILPRKALLAIAAVVEVALHARGRPFPAKALAARHGLPPRHLEPVLQALVHSGILKGVRGPHGGYELARDRARITINDIVHAASRIADDDDVATASALIMQVVGPAVARAERAMAEALAHINIGDLVQQAESLTVS